MAIGRETALNTTLVGSLERSVAEPREALELSRFVRAAYGAERREAEKLYDRLLIASLHLARHEPAHLKLGAMRLGLEERDLQARFLQRARLVAARERRILQELDGAEIPPPRPHTMALIASCHYAVSQRNPKLMLGWELAMRGATARVVNGAADALRLCLKRPHPLKPLFEIDAPGGDAAEVLERHVSPREMGLLRRFAGDAVVLYRTALDALCEDL